MKWLARLAIGTILLALIVGSVMAWRPVHAAGRSCGDAMDVVLESDSGLGSSATPVPQPRQVRSRSSAEPRLNTNSFGRLSPPVPA